MNFITRFETLASRRRRLQLLQVVAAVVLVALAAFMLLAAVDYVLEVPWSGRLIAGTLAAAGLAVCGIKWASRAIVETSRPATAADVEKAFPQLGQSVRTTVQYADPAADESDWQGVAPSLIAALVDRTDQRTAPVALETVAPSRTFWMLSVAVVFLVAVGGVTYSTNWEWRIAAQRTLLQDSPYSALRVPEQAMTVDEGGTASIVATVTGRMDEPLHIWTRRQDKPDAEWTEQVLEQSRSTKDPNDPHPRHEYATRLTNLTLPHEYRVTAGELSAGPFSIAIRRPVKIDSIAVELASPAYTQVKSRTVVDGNVSALIGTIARFSFTFDKPVKSAVFVLAPLHRPSNADGSDEIERKPLAMETTSAGESVRIGTIDLTLDQDRQYSIDAEATDGTRLRPNRYRIRIQHDQPPKVSFETPRDGIEVHSLAELPMRVRVQDDYGLTTAGVVFQINNEQEIPLLSENFEAVAAAAKAATDGEVPLLTQKQLERVLPLEHFALTQKDSVMYYGYAEDNRPDAPQRTVTDMQFIDIRPFKRLYQLYNPDPGGGSGGGGGLRSLEEFIHRQRFGLNRTLQIERKASSGSPPAPGTLDQLIKYETELAGHVRNFAQGLESRGFDDTALLYQAEETIIAAVDSLSVGKWSTATQQMRDALKFLIEQRDRTIELIMKNPDPALLAALRSFDRLQQQKLRRPKSDKEEARELLTRLQTLIRDQDAVAEALTPDGTEKPEAAPAPEEQK